MGAAIGLSVGATRLAGVHLGRTAVSRESVAEFIERVGDPVPVVAVDGSVHRGEYWVAGVLRELLHTMTSGRSMPSAVTHPAHWRLHQVDALGTALRQPLTSEVAAAVSALQSERGVPVHGVIVLCDFGGTGTSVTLLDASRGYQPICPTLRHRDFSGEQIDRALMAHVVADLSIDATGTSALGPLHRLRAHCRAAKERLSNASVTALTAELPGFSGDVRVTRTELDSLIESPLVELFDVVQEALDRNGVRPVDVAALATVGGGARIPLVTTMASERFRVPVITTARPELAAAIGAALRAAWGPADDRSTAIAPAPVAPPVLSALRASGSSPFADADAQSATFRALAWSDAHDVPPVAKPVVPTGVSSARPELEFVAADPPAAPERPWYRRGSRVAGIAATVATLLAASAVVAFGSDDRPAVATAPPASPTTSAPAGSPVAAQSQDPPPRTVVVEQPPATQYQAPVSPYQAPAPSPPAPPPPSTQTTTLTTTVTEPPPTTQPSTTEPPPPPPPPPTQTSTPPTSTQPQVTLTIPPIPTIPGLPNPPHNP